MFKKVNWTRFKVDLLSLLVFVEVKKVKSLSFKLPVIDWAERVMQNSKCHSLAHFKQKVTFYHFLFLFLRRRKKLLQNKTIFFGHWNKFLMIGVHTRLNTLPQFDKLVWKNIFSASCAYPFSLSLCLYVCPSACLSVCLTNAPSRRLYK